MPIPVDAPGAKFWAFDFHIHTPASHDHRNKKVSPEEIVQAALAVQLDAIVITDHNCADFVDRVVQAAQDTGLSVFPGVEISATGGHVLAVFDLGTPKEIVEDAIVACGIERAKFLDPEAIGKNITEVVKAIVENGGLAIAAHIDHEMGFLTRLHEGPAQAALYNSPYLSALEIVEPGDREYWQIGKHPDHSHLDRPRACIQSSDSHKLADIGRRMTYLKMERPSLEGIRLAFDDPLVNICFPEDLPSLIYPRIVSLSVSAGFLGGNVFEFNPGLNCLIGGKGTGKSTIIEYLRFVLDQQSELTEIENDTSWKVMELAGTGTLVSVVVQEGSGSYYEITREVHEPFNPVGAFRIVEDGSRVSVPNLNVSQFFKIHAFSQGEATLIARNRMSQIQLIDAHIDLIEENEASSTQKRKLAENKNQILQIDHQLSEYETKKKRVNTLKELIQTKRSQLMTLQDAQNNPAFAKHDAWEKERGHIDRLISEYDRLIGEIIKAFGSINASYAPPLALDDATSSPDIMSNLDLDAQRTIPMLEEYKNKIVGDLRVLKAGVEKGRQDWYRRYNLHLVEYNELKSRFAGTTIQQLTSDVEGLRQRETKAIAELTQLEKHQATKLALRNERNELLQGMKDVILRIQSKRDRQVHLIQEDIGDVISIGLLEAKNKDAFFAILRHHLKSTNMHTTSISRVVDRLTPLELVQIIESQDIPKLQTQCELSVDTATRIVNILNANLQAKLELEEVICDDLLDIRLRVGTVGETVYRSLDRLSAGQRATVIMLIALTEGKSPVVFDQPEDSLDTAFIYSDIVRILRRAKRHRQFIFATHNANISISSHLDHAIVLNVNESAAQSEISVSGAIDDMGTKDQLLRHLEGGDVAFKQRERKYKIPPS